MSHRRRAVSGRRHHGTRGTGTVTPTAGWMSGVVPGVNRIDPIQNATAFGTWRGRAVDVIVDFGYPSLSSAGRMVACGGSTTPGSRTGPAASGGPQLIWSMALTVNSGLLSDVASGSKNTVYAAEFARLVAYGFKDAWIRLGWESDADYFSWGVQKKGLGTFAVRCQQYQDAWRNVVTTARANGFTGKFIFNVMRLDVGQGAQNPDLWYPGDDIVDIISCDHYFDNYQGTGATAAQIFANARIPMDYLRTYAATHGKMFGFDEWGLYDQRGTHGVTDPAVVGMMRDWLETYQAQIGYEAYFNAWDANDNPGTIVGAVAAGATSLVVSDGTKFYTRGGALRIGAGSSIRQILYTGGGGNPATNSSPTITGPATLTGIPSSGYGSIPTGGYPDGQLIRRSIKNNVELAVGPVGDCENGTPLEDTRFKLGAAAATYRTRWAA